MAFFRGEAAKRGERSHAEFLAAAKSYVLRGRVVTMNGAGDVINDGIICIDGDTIALVAPWTGAPPSPFDTAPVISTGGTIYPGLIELHNHPAFNVIPLWPVPHKFDNRGQWRADAAYKRQVSNPDYLLCNHPNATYPKSLVRFVECRALLGGVTTTQGISYQSGTPLRSYFEGLVRNVEFPVRNWPVASDYINDFTSSDDAENRIGAHLRAGTPAIIHLCEGTDATTTAIFDNLRKADGSWLIGSPLISIHCTGLGEAQFRTLADNNAGGIVWSPLSNMLLYGDTTKVMLARDAGLPVAIGCDWGPSGTKNLLGELKIAKAVSDHEGGLFSDRELVEAVTRIPASMLGWLPFVGTLEARKAADFLILDGAGGDPYRNLIETDESKIVAVVIDGRPRSGRATIVDPRTPGVELIHVAGQDLVLDIIDAANHPLGGTTLTSAIATMEHALQNLPDVAREAHNMSPLMVGATEQWRPVPDYEDRESAPLFSAGSLPGPGEVEPLNLDPITAIDDSNFADRIRANGNVPGWLKAAL